MKIILADDHTLFRDGLCSMLGTGSTCLEASDLDGLLLQLQEHQDSDLILMDLNMPGMVGFEGLKKVKNLCNNIPLAVVSMHNDPDTIRKAMAFGISGYIPKTYSFECMKKAVDLILSGAIYVPCDILGSGDGNPYSAIQLTQRQKDIYKLLMQGKSNREIAEKIYISLSTVKMHVSAVLKKTGVKNRAQLLASERSPFT